MTAIPVEVILAGACIQISEAPSGIQVFLDEFLNKWRCVDENHYVLKVEPDMLRKLHSLYSDKIANKSSLVQINEDEAQICSHDGLQALDGSSTAYKGADVSEQSILKMSSRVEPCFWFFHSVTLKFGKTRLVITTTKVLVSCLICLVVFYIKNKRQTLFRMAKKKVMSARKALADLWQLAFSYQVNPLAAVQPLPAATRGT